jgi:GNAT superfamily N-acetyltransferase
MRCSHYCATVDEVGVVRASVDDVRTIARRRRFDDAAFRLALELGDRGTVWAARDQGEVVGIAHAVVSEDERYVGDLFVEPSYRGHGIGRRLLDAAFDDADGAAHAMLVDPANPANTALALRYRCIPRDMLLSIAGAIPREEELAKMAAGDYRFGVEPLDLAAHDAALDAVDREVRGTVRSGDHRFFSRHADGHVFSLNGEIVAYAYLSPDGRIGPLACSSAAYLVQIFAYTLRALQQRHQASWCTLLLPSSNVRIGRAALRAGLRIQETYAFARDSYDGNISTYIGYHKLLY